MEKILSLGIVKGIIIEISFYSDELVNIIKKYFKWVIDIGFDLKEKIIRENTTHLKESKNYTHIDQWCDNIKSMTEQKMILFMDENLSL